MAFVVWNILDMLKASDEESLHTLLSTFSCNKIIDGKKVNLNPDNEHFIKENAIQFALEKKSITYIVGDEDDGAFLGYFSITHKSVNIPASGLSNTTIKRMKRFAELNEETNSFSVSGYLIAQSGKNYAIDNGTRISGKELMELTQGELSDSQHRIGGRY